MSKSFQRNKKAIPAAAVVFYAALLLISLLFHCSTLLGTLICLSLQVVFYGSVFFAVRLFGGFEVWKTIERREKLLWLICAAAALVFLEVEICQDHFIYYWDYSNYWIKSIECSRDVFQNPPEMLKTLFKSIFSSSYNDFAAMLLALPIRIFGTSFPTYTVLNGCFFLFPSPFILLLLVHRISDLAGQRKTSRVFAVLLFLIPQFYIPVLYGYIDSAALLPVSCLLFIATGVDWLKMDPSKCLLIVLMILLTLVLRRYFAYFAVGYVAGICFSFLVQVIEERAERKKIVLSFLKNTAVTGAVCLIVGTVPFLYVLKKIRSRNLSVAYSAYSFGGLADKTSSMIQSFGLLLCLFALAGMVIGFSCRKLRAFTSLLFGSALVSAFLFLRIQNMGIQHFYILILQICILAFMGATGIAQRIPQKAAKKATVAVAALFAAVNFSYSFEWIPSSPAVNRLFSNEFYTPKIRNDIPVIQAMAKDLTSMSDGNRKKVYCISSSTVFNDSILQDADLPNVVFAVPSMSITSHVDLRDGFNTDFLQSDIVVVADPIQYHLAPKDQRVIGILASEMLSGRLGKHFTPVKQYCLDSGVTARVYIKNMPFTKDDVKSLSKEFDSVYPQYPQLFKDRILSGVQ